MNEVMEALSGAFKELRSDCGGREYYIRSAECEEAERVMNEAEAAYEGCVQELSDEERERLSSYIGAMANYHFEEEQRAYLQGMTDAVLLLDGFGLLAKGARVKEILDMMNR